jgi:hypothetical protein
VNVCHGCWNSEKYVFDADDLDYCPEHRNDDFQFICQRAITPVMVYEKILNRL